MASPYAIRKIINKTFSGRFMLSRLSHVAFIGRAIELVIADPAFASRTRDRLTAAVDLT